MNDYTELAARMLGMTEQEYDDLVDNDEGSELDKIDAMLDEKYGLSIDSFSDIVQDLLPMTVPQQGALGGDFKHIMGVTDGRGFRAIVRIPSDWEVLEK
ncbi:hypothetical protein [Photobacterium indicum]|uniref:hypothetical protein n=1 Tax=Photobacterium indicum TaxID=81447 RepID=UPI003D09C5FC